jgi:hypothetical protein
MYYTTDISTVFFNNFPTNFSHVLEIFEVMLCHMQSEYTGEHMKCKISMQHCSRSMRRKKDKFGHSLCSRFCDLHIQVFSKDIVSTPALITSVFKFSPHTCKHGRRNYGHSRPYPLSKWCAMVQCQQHHLCTQKKRINKVVLKAWE